MGAGHHPVIVGPNNSGKTSTLREIQAILAGNEAGPVFDSIIIQTRGDLRDITEWLHRNVALVPARTSQKKRCFHGWGLNAQQLAIQDIRGNGEKEISEHWREFCPRTFL